MAENEQKLTTVSPKWTRPDEVMKQFRLNLKMKMKKRKLQARMMNRTNSAPVLTENSTSGFNSSSSSLSNQGTVEMRKNPFRRNVFKKQCNKGDKEESECFIESASNDNTLFNLLNFNNPSQESIVQYPVSFASILSQITQDEATPAPSLRPVSRQPVPPLGKTFIPVDWTLKTKLRFTSPKPFAWNQKLRTCEEASGITGFVRCLSTESELDTSPNARFHQCCLVWQHPALPWLTLFPRASGRAAEPSVVNADPKVKASLLEEFTESFRSLFQLVRARQCPYFYMCANAFTCLFRAAGVCGHTDVNAMLTPTTRGFRQTLKQEDVVYSMPLSKSRQSGGDTQPIAGLGEEDDDDDEGEGWLESLGVDKAEIQRLNKKQAKLQYDKERTVDRTPESLVYVEGVEAQAMFNFLLNCKSLVAQTGPLAGVSPTLLAPVAFHGATLKPLRARQSLVKVGATMFHSMELCGPILPHTLHNLCSLLENSLDEFSAASVNVEPTQPFTLAARVALAAQPETNPPEAVVFSPGKTPAAFNKVNLSDCGLQPAVLERFCSDDVDRVRLVDSIKFNHDQTYTWD